MAQNLPKEIWLSIAEYLPEVTTIILFTGVNKTLASFADSKFWQLRCLKLGIPNEQIVLPCKQFFYACANIFQFTLPASAPFSVANWQNTFLKFAQDQAVQPTPMLIKVLLMGGMAVGKTTLMYALAGRHRNEHATTIGMDFVRNMIVIT